MSKLINTVREKHNDTVHTVIKFPNKRTFEIESGTDGFVTMHLSQSGYPKGFNNKTEFELFCQGLGSFAAEYLQIWNKK
jgi:hypothetical protein